MKEKALPSSPVTRVVTVLGLVSLLALLGFLALIVYRWNTPPTWTFESYTFDSGSSVCIFLEPQLAFVIGNDLTFEGHYSQFGQPFSPGLTIKGGHTGGSSTNLGGCMVYEYNINRQGTTIRFIDGKHKMQLNFLGTELTLADGRVIKLKESPPHCLQIKNDGTVIVLDKLPEPLDRLFHSIQTQPETFPRSIRK